MKIALCLSGQPRFVEEAYPNIFKTIIEPNDPDVFLHAWYDKDMIGTNFVNYSVNGWDNNKDKSKYQKGTDLKILDLYKPKKYIF
jgi:hypothetical protein